MKVVFKVCCAPEEQQQNTSINSQSTIINNNGNGHHHQQTPPHHGTGVSINTNIDPNNRLSGTGNGAGGAGVNSGSAGSGNAASISGGRMIPPMINTNSSNVVQSTISWPGGWSNNNNNNNNNAQSTPVTTTLSIQPFHPHMTSPRPNINNANGGSGDPNSNYPPSHNKPTKKTSKLPTQISIRSIV